MNFRQRAVSLASSIAALCIVAGGLCGCSAAPAQVASQKTESATVTTPEAGATGAGTTGGGSAAGATIAISGAVTEKFTVASVGCIVTPNHLLVTVNNRKPAAQVTFMVKAEDHSGVLSATFTDGSIAQAAQVGKTLPVYGVDTAEGVARHNVVVEETRSGSSPAFHLSGTLPRTDTGGDSVTGDAHAACAHLTKLDG